MTTLVATPVAIPDTLSFTDRCDLCSAQAYVLVSVPVSALGKDCNLLFCSHHFSYHQPALISQGVQVLIDNRDQLVSVS